MCSRMEKEEEEVYKYIADRTEICYIYIRLINEGYCNDERYIKKGIKENLAGVLRYCDFADEIESIRNAANRAMEVKKDE